MSGLLERLILRAAGRLPLVTRRRESPYEASSDGPDGIGIDEAAVRTDVFANPSRAEVEPDGTRGAPPVLDESVARIESAAREIQVDGARAAAAMAATTTRAAGPRDTHGREGVEGAVLRAEPASGGGHDGSQQKAPRGPEAVARPAPRLASPEATPVMERAVPGRSDARSGRDTILRTVERERVETHFERHVAVPAEPVTHSQRAHDERERAVSPVRVTPRVPQQVTGPARSRSRIVAERAQEAQPAGPHVSIAIGTVEIRASPISTAAPQRRSEAPRPEVSPMGLEEYLRGTGGP